MKYLCVKCGFESLRWMGKCSQCGGWSTMEELAVEEEPLTRRSGKKGARRAKALRALKLDSKSVQKRSRVQTGIDEFDRVLGGGLLPGSTTIVSGDPGIGKSTLLSGVAISLVLNGKKVLYVSGEESSGQVIQRFERLVGSKAAGGAGGRDWERLKGGLSVISSNDVDAIAATIEKNKPDVAVVDSIQAVGTVDLPGFLGGLSQVRESTMRLSRVARTQGLCLFITAQVTKAGGIAGPKILEHIVDVVLYLEGDKFGRFRILRGLKNRFGSTQEIGVFEMAEKGMREVKNASAVFLSERKEEVSGVVTVCTMEGTRPILVEVQALTAPSQFSLPKRVANGVNRNKVELLCAILSRRAGLDLSGTDVYVNVIGGVSLREPGVDLGIALAIASTYKDKPVNGKCLVVGEVGLTGEIVQVPFLKERREEGRRLKYSKFLGPGEFGSLKELLIKVLR